MQIVALDANSSHSGDVIFANVTYQTKGIEGQTTDLNLTVRDLEDYYNYTQIGHYISNGSFRIKDVTPPVYEWILRPTEGTTGDPKNVSLLVTDNLSVVTGYTISLAGSAGDGTHTMSKNGDYYNYTIQVRSDSIANITYSCRFTDAEGVSNTTGDVTMTVTDNDKPTITVALSRDIILNDHSHRARPPGTNQSRLNVTAIDNIPDGIANVTVNQSAITGQPAHPIPHKHGTDMWWMNLKALTHGINCTNTLVITVTDNAGNCNTSTVYLTVLRRGDVVRDNTINSGDVLYIAKYLVGKESMPSLLVADVVPAIGNGLITSGDALYIAKFLANIESAP